MNRTVQKGKTLLVDGPASVTVTSGMVEIFGFVPSPTNKIVIREGKRLPFAVQENATFDISLAEKAGAEEVDGNTIPESWAKASEELVSLQAKPATVVVLGAVDSGKTSFCTYLVNRSLSNKKRKVAILDGDLGQSDIGPPCTVAYTFVAKPVTDLFNLMAKNTVFIGATSPNGVTQRVIESLNTMKNEILPSNPDIIVVNSDGWIEGEDAVSYKVRLVETLSPDMIFCFQQKDEPAPLLNALEKYRRVIVDSPSLIDQRSRESRKNLRELGYVKYLRNARVLSLPLGWLKIENDELFGLGKTFINVRESRKIYDLLGMKPLHLVDQPDRVTVIIGRKRWINGENLRKVEETTKKKVIVVRKGEEEGLLRGLYNAHRKFLGIGLVKEVEYLRKTIKILTPVSGDIAVAVLGKVKLDKNMKEVPALEESQTDAGFSKLF
jgi:polynucleotide 5'-hydroxyl-kinase GRC3/NOL9